MIEEIAHFQLLSVITVILILMTPLFIFTVLAMAGSVLLSPFPTPPAFIIITP
jgi:hypothetical protein